MVPDGWEVKELQFLCKKIAVGLAISVTPFMKTSGVKLIRNQNIKRNYFNSDSVVYIDEVFANSNKSKKVRHGDVVAVRTGSNIGEACVVPKDFDGALTFTTLIARPNPALLDSFYLSTHINSDLGISEVNRLCAGGGKPNLNSGELKRYRLLTPPLDEQKKIAQILSTWDKAITTTEQLLANSQQQKKALMQQLLTGKKRLLDNNGVRFSGEWKRVELGDLLDYQQPTPYLVESTEYSDNFSTPVLTAGKTFILGYTDEESGIFSGKLPAIIFDDFTTDSKFVDFPFKAKSSAMKILTAKDGVSIRFVYEAMQMIDFAVGGHQRHWISIYSHLVIPFPGKEEQQKIAAVLSTADQEVSVLQQKLDALKQEKKALMQQLLTGKRRVQIN